MSKKQTQAIVVAPKPATAEEAAGKVFRLMLDGHSKADIVEACEQLFLTHDPVALIRTATDNFAVAAAEPSHLVLGWCREAARDLYRRLIEVGDFEGALRAVALLHKLGTNPKKAKP